MIHQNMDSNHVATQAGIRQMIRDQNDNSGHYLSFYREMCDVLNSEHGVSWFFGGRG